MQPSVFDLESFKLWAAEAFELWRSDWRSLYEEGSPAHAVLEAIRSTWVLVSVTDNDFLHGEVLPSVM